MLSESVSKRMTVKEQVPHIGLLAVVRAEVLAAKAPGSDVIFGTHQPVKS